MSVRGILTNVLCGHCGQRRAGSRLILDVPVCERCRLRFGRHATTCPLCQQLRVLAFTSLAGQPACATCTGAKAVYACQRCGREDSPFGRMCGPCTLHERATALLAQPGGGVHPQLLPLFEALLASPRPQTTLYWFTRSSGPDILRSMAVGDLEITHQALADMPASRTVTYLRDLLVAVGVLPPYDAELERLTLWLNELLSTVPTDQADVLRRFGRWHVLRRLRQQEQHASLTSHGAINGARARITAAAGLLRWLQEHETTLRALSQTDLDTYTVERPGQATSAGTFLTWAHLGGLTSDLTMATRPRAHPEVTLADADRWAHVELLLHDNTLRLPSRIAGLFMLLFAQPLSRICRMHADQISVGASHTVVTVTFDAVAIGLPVPLALLVREHLSRRGHASYAGHREGWLSPGGIPGRPLTTESVRGQLVARGIHPGRARKAAMFQLAAEMPSPVLADLLGLHAQTANRWAALSAHDWSQYTAQRVPSSDCSVVTGSSDGQAIPPRPGP